MQNKNSEKRFELRLTEELYEKIKAVAAEKDLTMTAMIKIILLDYLTKKELN